MLNHIYRSFDLNMTHFKETSDKILDKKTDAMVLKKKATKTVFVEK